LWRPSAFRARVDVASPRDDRLGDPNGRGFGIGRAVSARRRDLLGVDLGRVL
jgi:hypothetical protein